MRLLSLYKLSRPLFTNYFDSRSIYTSVKRLALTTFKLSDIGEGINEVQLVKWDKKVGDEVEEMESVCTVQSDKAAVEITSRFTGTVKKLYVNEGETIKIGAPLMDIDTLDEVPENTNVNVNSSSPGDTKRHYSTITTPIKTYSNSSIYTHKHYSTKPNDDNKKDEDVVEVKLDFIGTAMVKSMVASLEVPHVTVGEEVDLTDLTRLYKWYRTNPPESSDGSLSGLKITITPFILKCLSLALEKVPIMNSKFNGDSYLLYKNHNISVAINTKHGLMVPNIKNVNKLSVRDIQKELTRLQQKANDKMLGLNDIKGGTCTLSNLGPLGGTFINARLFDGQAAIVAIGRAINRVVPVLNSMKDTKETKLKESNGTSTNTTNSSNTTGSSSSTNTTNSGSSTSTKTDNSNVNQLKTEEDFKLELRSLCSVGVTADHRHIDGATIATFISHFKNFLQDAESLKQYF